VVIQLPRCPKCWRLVLPEAELTLGLLFQHTRCRNPSCAERGKIVEPEWVWALDVVEVTVPEKEAGRA